MNNFKKLEVWNKSMTLVSEVYKHLNNFPKEEIYGLSNQIKKSAISIPSNIAEGCGRNSPKQFKYHLNVALGSSFELETQILIGEKLNFTIEDESSELLMKNREISKMLIGLTKSLDK